jgi:hypothetical protein
MSKIAKYLIFLSIFAPSALSFHLVYRTKPFGTSLSPAESKKAALVLDTFEWPSSVGLFSDETGAEVNEKNLRQYAELLKEAPNAETNFLRTRIQEISPALEVVWIPTTLWEIFAMAYKYTQANTKDVDTERPAMTKQLLSMLQKLGIFKPGKVPIFDKAKLTLAIEQILQKFKGRGKIELDFPEVKDALLEEIALLPTNDSVIVAAIDAEIDAQKKNRVLLYRATPGIPISADQADEAFLALDFVVPAASEADFKKGVKPSIATSLKYLETMVKTKEYENRDLSGQYSLFGGCLNDVGICPYYYLRVVETKILYALSLSKEFVYERGKQLMYLPKLSLQHLLFSEGILGHPRFRRIGMLRNFDSLLGGENFKWKFYEPLSELFVKTSDSRKETKFFSFLFESMDIITTEAKILSIGDKNAYVKDDWAADQIMLNQRAAFELLKKEIRALHPAKAKAAGL